MTEPDKPTPSLYEWAGGEPAIRRLMDCFYDRVERDDLLGPRFFPDGVGEDHRAHVTAWWSEVLGGPARYTEELGGYEGMLAHHRGLAITPEQRFRFASLLSLAADDAGLPDDPEFRSALVAYAEWGSRLAMHNSQPEPRSSNTPPCRAGAGARRPLPALGGGRSQLRCLGSRLLFVQSGSTALSRRRSLNRVGGNERQSPTG